MTQRVTGPDGVVNNFPDDMADDSISKAMSAAYPSKATPSVPSPMPGSGWASDEHLGKAIGFTNDWLVQPFEKMAAWGAQKGGDLAMQGMAGTIARSRGTPESVQQATQEFPRTAGATKAVGEVVGGMVTDPRNYPLLALGGAQNAAKRLLSLGFSGQMLYGAYQQYPEFKQALDAGDHESAARVLTHMGLAAGMGAMAGAHGLMPESPMPGIKAERLPTAEEVPSPLGEKGLEQVAAIKTPGAKPPKLDPNEAQTLIGQAKFLDAMKRPENQTDYSNWTPEEIAQHKEMLAEDDSAQTPPRSQVGGVQQEASPSNPPESTPPPTSPSGPREPVPPSKGPAVTGPDPSTPKGLEATYASLKARVANAENPNAPAPSLGDLTSKIDASIKASPRSEGVLRRVERLAQEQYGDTKDAVIESIGKLHAQSRAFWNQLGKAPMLDSFETALGRFSGAMNRSAWELRKFSNSIKDKMPDKLRREALTNWVQANGDDGVLADRALKTKPGRIQDGYVLARELTPTEKSYGRMVRDHMDSLLNEAMKQGIVKHGVDNYVQQLWKPADQENASKLFSTGTSGSALRPNPSFSKQRVFSSYFEGEQHGYEPRDKDIGFLTANYVKSFNTAIMSRNFIDSLHEGLAKDGRPLVAPGGKGMPIGGDETGPDAYLIFPKAGPEETEDYKTINHPAMRDWKWATKDTDGNPIFVQGDLRVHPQVAGKLENVLEQSGYKAPPVVQGILKGSNFFKQTLLTGAWFHQVQEGIHAIFHGVSPFNVKDIDLTDPTTQKLLDGGLVLGHYNAMAAFEEGLSTGGLLKFAPGVGQYLQKYNEYLFQDYIPRLKHAMASEAYERNLKRFMPDRMASRVTPEQIARLTANQANAAFGELNYMTLGRDPRMQNAFRLMALAPDFTEARARFVGNALESFVPTKDYPIPGTNPVGREQLIAVGLRGALSMYVMARVANYIINKDTGAEDPTYKDKPFSVIYKGQEYQQRSLPDDVYKSLDDPRSFIYHRLNPSTMKPLVEGLMGRDEFGRKRQFGQQMMDLARGILPIPLQGVVKSDSEHDWKTSLLQSVGTTKKQYRSPAEKMAHDYSLSNMPTDITSRHIMEQTRKYETGKFDPDEMRQLIKDGAMSQDDAQKVFDNASTPEFIRNYKGLPIEQQIKVYMATTPKERYRINLEVGEPDVQRLPPNMQKPAFDKLQQLERK